MVPAPTWERWEVALHESTHCLVALDLDREVRHISIHPAPATEGLTLLDMRGRRDGGGEDLENLMILLSGDLALEYAAAGWPHSRARPGRWWLSFLAEDPELKNVGTASLDGGGDAARMAKWTAEDRDVARMRLNALLPRLWPRIQTLAGALLDQGELDGPEILEICRGC